VREREWQRLYLAYFDSSKTRSEGRRVSKELAVERPRLEDVDKAVEELGLKARVVEEARYPRCWWNSKGMVLVEKKLRKGELLRRVAEAVREARTGLRRERR